MTKSFTFVIFLLGILIAQVACSRPTQSESTDSKSSNGPTEVASTPNNEPKSAPTSSTSEQPKADDNAPWILPGFDKTQVLRMNKIGKRCWQNAKYHVCLTRNEADTNLYWKNEISNAKVEMNISNDDGSISQDWAYQSNQVQINKLKDGSLTQQWQLGSSKFEINEFPGKTAESKWQGAEDPAALKKYQEFIDAWCKNNDYFVGEYNCPIYDKTKVNNDPSAWILPGFDKTQVLRMSENGKRCWQNAKYHVCFTKNEAETKLYWKNERSNTTVEMVISKNDGSISQDWTYQRNHVQINKLKDGSLTQQWQLGSSKFEINKFVGKTAESKWNGAEDPKALKKYQDFIDAWCENNDCFVKKDDCAIYKI